MSTAADDTTFDLFRRAAMDADQVWEYPTRVTFVDPKLAAAPKLVWEALHEGQEVVMHSGGVELLIEWVRPTLFDRARGRQPVSVAWRPLVFEGEPILAGPARMRSTVTRTAVFDFPRSLAPV